MNTIPQQEKPAGSNAKRLRQNRTEQRQNRHVALRILVKVMPKVET